MQPNPRKHDGDWYNMSAEDVGYDMTTTIMKNMSALLRVMSVGRSTTCTFIPVFFSEG